MLSPGQDHDLTCAQPSHRSRRSRRFDRRQGVRRRRLHRRPQRFERSSRSSHPISNSEKPPRPVLTSPSTANAISLSVLFQQAQAFPGHRHVFFFLPYVTTSSPRFLPSPPSTSPAPPSSSTEDRPLVTGKQQGKSSKIGLDNRNVLRITAVLSGTCTENSLRARTGNSFLANREIVFAEQGSEQRLQRICREAARQTSGGPQSGVTFVGIGLCCVEG